MPDFLNSLLPGEPWDATTGVAPSFPTPQVYPPSPAPDAPLPDAAERATIKADLEDLRRQCHQLARRQRELPFQVVAHNEIAALNAVLLRIVPLNRALRDYHRSARVSVWGDKPVPMGILMSPADLIPDLDAALAVISAYDRYHHE